MKPVVAKAAVLDTEQSGCQCQLIPSLQRGPWETIHWLFLPSLLAKLVESLNKVQNCRKLKSAQPMEAKEGRNLYEELGLMMSSLRVYGKRGESHFPDSGAAFDKCPHQERVKNG